MDRRTGTLSYTSLQHTSAVLSSSGDCESSDEYIDGSESMRILYNTMVSFSLRPSHLLRQERQVILSTNIALLICIINHTFTPTSVDAFQFGIGMLTASPPDVIGRRCSFRAGLRTDRASGASSIKASKSDPSSLDSARV